MYIRNNFFIIGVKTSEISTDQRAQDDRLCLLGRFLRRHGWNPELVKGRTERREPEYAFLVPTKGPLDFETREILLTICDLFEQDYFLYCVNLRCFKYARWHETEELGIWTGYAYGQEEPESYTRMLKDDSVYVIEPTPC